MTPIDLSSGEAVNALLEYQQEFQKGYQKYNETISYPRGYHPPHEFAAASTSGVSRFPDGQLPQLGTGAADVGANTSASSGQMPSVVQQEIAEWQLKAKIEAAKRRAGGREARRAYLYAMYKKYVDFVRDPNNRSIVFGTKEEAFIAGAIWAAMNPDYDNFEYIWGIEAVPRAAGGWDYRPTASTTDRNPRKVNARNNPHIQALRYPSARNESTLSGIGYNHPGNSNMSGYCEGWEIGVATDRTLARTYAISSGGPMKEFNVYMAKANGNLQAGNLSARTYPEFDIPPEDLVDLIEFLREEIGR